MHFEFLLGRLEQPAGTEQRLDQPVGRNSLEGGEKAQLRQLIVAPSDESFYTTLRKLSFEENVRQAVG